MKSQMLGKLRSVLFLSLSVGLNATLTLMPQILSLILMKPAHFGLFSVLYLVYAFAISLSLSAVCEPLIRSGTLTVDKNTQRGYSSTLMAVSAFAGLIGAVLSLVVQLGALVSILAFCAIALGAFRAGLRFYVVGLNDTQSVLLGDLLGVIGFFSIGFFLVYDDGNVTVSILGAWALSNFLSLIVNYRFMIFSPHALRGWIFGHKADIGHLLKDSLLMDLGAIFIPLLIAPFLGASAFGTYRAVSNVAAPVRLVLNPLRPLIGSQAKTGQFSYRLIVLGSATIGLIFGVGTSGVLWFLDYSEIQIGTITSLGDYLIPVGLFVFANFVGHMFYVRARIVCSGKLLFSGRMIQTALMTVGPISGVILCGLSGAIWSLSIVTCFSAASWICIARNVR